MSKTFSNLKVKNMELKNRIVMPPMCMYSSDDGGYVKDFHHIHYGTRAIGGVGLIILEATAVERRGRITNADLGIYEDGQIEGLKKLVEQLHQFGAKAGVQLAHAGRKCGVATEAIIAPSAIAFSEKFQTPKEMTKDDIKTVVEAFKNAARRADRAGFDIIEIHAAHGYLINEFLSPLANKRNDEYNGNIENRARLLCEVLDAVHMVWPQDKPVIIRVSAEEFNEKGNHVEDLVKVINLVKNKIDIVDVSTGGVVLADINLYPGYQINYADKIKKETGVVSIGGGLISEVQMVEEILQNNRADLVFLGREILRNPYFVLNAASELHEELEWPRQYKRAKL